MLALVALGVFLYFDVIESSLAESLPRKSMITINESVCVLTAILSSRKDNGFYMFSARLITLVNFIISCIVDCKVTRARNCVTEESIKIGMDITSDAAQCLQRVLLSP